jgi:hypothetical protein
MARRMGVYAFRVRKKTSMKTLCQRIGGIKELTTLRIYCYDVFLLGRVGP